MSRGIYDKDNDRLILIAGKEDTSVPTFTMAEWEAMTDAQKAEYDGKLFVISDDFNGMTVDDELSTTSVRPVQNKVITSEIQTLTNDEQATRDSIAPTEDGTNYSKSYSKGDEFFRNGTLYKVTASSVNSSIAIITTSGGNAEEVPSVVKQMYAMPHTLSTSNAVSVDTTGITTSSDGYFVIKCSYAVGNYVIGSIGGTRVMAVTASDRDGSMATYPTAALFVRKGTQISATSNSFTEPTNTATFYPLI